MRTATLKTGDVVKIEDKDFEVLRVMKNVIAVKNIKTLEAFVVLKKNMTFVKSQTNTVYDFCGLKI